MQAGGTNSTWTEMAIDHTIPELDRKGLREFGLTTGAAVVGIFGLFFPWLFELNWPAWPWAIATPLWLLALAQPSWLRGIYRGWMRFGLLVSRVTTPLLLGVVFFAMISPMAWVRRLRGNDPMQRSFDPQRDSYRIQTPKSPREKLERPF